MREQFCCPHVADGRGESLMPPSARCQFVQAVSRAQDRSEGETGRQGQRGDTPCNALAEGVRRELPFLDTEQCTSYTLTGLSHSPYLTLCSYPSPARCGAKCLCLGMPGLFLLCPPEKGSGRGTCRAWQSQSTGRNPQQQQNSHTSH